MSFYFQFSLTWLSSQSPEEESIARILSGLLRLGLLARARDDGPGSRNPAHQARAWDLSLSLAVLRVGGDILGPGSGWDSWLVLLRCQALLPYKTQVQCCIWDVQDRDSVWKKKTGNGGGVSVRNIQYQHLH